MVEVQTIPLAVVDSSNGFEDEEEGGEEEAWLREVEEVTKVFLLIYLEDQPRAQPLGGKSPAGRLSFGVEQSSSPSANAQSSATEVSHYW